MSGAYSLATGVWQHACLTNATTPAAYSQVFQNIAVRGISVLESLELMALGRADQHDSVDAAHCARVQNA
jgi:hypothetical protein